ncbi:MAG: hypothetical protein F4164_06875 [Gemmatimonadales bacterium]|nr:hypothetical protein [Gemmatimonadales bacterium]MYG49081.1 hypothetical protein [Gemmatimonadales bacterium]MYK02448.1 hypothetical protein [Candidatus Palauibacter ramosifaciens]
MNPARLIVLAVLLGLLAPVGAAAQGPVSDRDRFALFAACSPVPVEVFVTNTGGPADITTPAVEGMATSRLQAAGIDAPAGRPGASTLQLSVFVSAQRLSAGAVLTVYVIRLRLLKLLYDRQSDPRAGEAGRGAVDSPGAAPEWLNWAPTWETPQQGIGFYLGRDGGPVTNLVAGMLDEFVREYVRVNATACP